MSRIGRVVTGSPIFVFQILIRSLIGFVLPIYLSEAGGQELVGAYSFLLQLVGFCALLDLGIGQALMREFSQARGTKDAQKISEIIRSSFFLLVLAGFLSFAVVLILSLFIESFLSGSESTIGSLKGALLIYAFWFFFRFPLSIGQILTFSSQKLALFGYLALMVDVAQLFLIPIILMSGFGLQGLVIVIAISEMLAFSLHIYVNEAYFKLASTLSVPGYREVFLFLKVALPFGMMSLGDRLTYHTHSLIVGTLLGVSQLGAFHAMRSLGFLFASITWKLADLTFPGLNELYVSESKEKLFSAYVRLAGYLCGFGSWLAVMVFLINERFVTFWIGQEYVLDQLVSLLVGLYIPLSVLKNVSTKFILMERNFSWYLYIVIVEGIVVVIVSVILGSFLGASGVLLGMLIPQLLSFSFLVFRLSRMLQQSIGAIVVAVLYRVLRFSLLASILASLLVNFVSDSNFLWFFLGISLISCICFAFMLGFGLSKEDRTQVLSALGFNK